METLYLILFAAGAIYAVLTIFLGDIFDFQFDFGGQFPLLSPTTVATFVTVFGACGYVLERNTELGGLLIAFLSFVSAVILAGLMFLFIMLPLYKAEKSAAKSARDMIGRTAEVVTVIMHGTKGEILYEQGGVRLSAPARIAEGQTVKQGEIVQIVDVVSGTFVVKKADPGEKEAIWQ